MACVRMKPREERRAKLAKRYGNKRIELKKVAENRGMAFTYEEMREAQVKLRKMPRDASRIRQRCRCESCGRPRGFVGKFKLCRICVRKYGMLGWIPGLVMASW